MSQIGTASSATVSTWVSPQETATSVTQTIGAITLQRPFGWRWLAALVFAALLALLLTVGIGYLVATGVGIWGLNIPVAWAFAIADYVWWIAIGMGGTFISAALYLVRKPWRTSLNRYAEAMTVFAVSVSGLFPILHLGRPWFFYWLFPYPNVMNVWPQWRSSLEWDFFAIVAYLIVSILYWYIGMLPDLACLRDRAAAPGRARFYGLLALGWRGEARHWARFETLSRLLAGLAVPLVFSVHSMVALDFSEALVPGWHSTLFPPFFVAGALFSGFAMVMVLGIPMRHYLKLEAYITERHLANMAKLMLAVGLVVDYSYLADIFTSFYSMDRYEVAHTLNRLFGAYAWVFWCTILFNVLSIQLLWFRKTRASPAALMTISLGVLAGMWLERFMLIVTPLYEDFTPSAWGMYYPTAWDFAFLAGSIGLFLVLYLVFVRLLPVVSMFELRKLLHQLRERKDSASRSSSSDVPGRAARSHFKLPDSMASCGVLAEFDSADALRHAVGSVRRQMPQAQLEAYSPFPVEGLADSLGTYRDRIAPWMLLGAAAGGLGTLALECYAAGWNYPLNVGGRPPVSWPAFLPPAIEMTVLIAAVFGVWAMLRANALPRLRHPLFELVPFERASADRFFLWLPTAPAQFDEPLALLGTLSPLRLTEVSA